MKNCIDCGKPLTLSNELIKCTKCMGADHFIFSGDSQSDIKCSTIYQPEFYNMVVFKNLDIKPLELKQRCSDIALGYKNEITYKEDVLVRLFIVNDHTGSTIYPSLPFKFIDNIHGVDVYYCEINKKKSKVNKVNISQSKYNELRDTGQIRSDIIYIIN